MRRGDLLTLFILDAPALIAVATDPEEPARDRLLAVGRLGVCELIPASPAARAALARVAGEDPDPEVRDQAAAGLRWRQGTGLRLVWPSTPTG